MFDGQGRYVIQNYQNRTPFSSFLPGIAGPLGVPVWCYYNNRGQGVCSFGSQDKEHAIMEFSPARQAYRDVARTGFRTFCKRNGAVDELFTQNRDMHIGMSELEITCEQDGLYASAVYFGIPGERTAGVEATAFENLDGGWVAVLLNRVNKDLPISLTQNGIEGYSLLLPARCIATVCWTD